MEQIAVGTSCTSIIWFFLVGASIHQGHSNRTKQDNSSIWVLTQVWLDSLIGAITHWEVILSRIHLIEYNKSAWLVDQFEFVCKNVSRLVGWIFRLFLIASPCPWFCLHIIAVPLPGWLVGDDTGCSEIQLILSWRDGAMHARGAPLSAKQPAATSANADYDYYCKGVNRK